MNGEKPIITRKQLSDSISRFGSLHTNAPAISIDVIPRFLKSLGLIVENIPPGSTFIVNNFDMRELSKER